MADFKPGNKVVVREAPHLLGIGMTIETPAYSHERLTWANFESGTECAFEPGELMLAADWLKQHAIDERP
jgi:hypothetical protein